MPKLDRDLQSLGPSSLGSDFLPIDVEAVHLRFGDRSVFERLSLQIDHPRITAIMGPNGAGKSLCLRLMAGLIRPDAGRVLYAGKQVIPKAQLGFVFQRPVLLRRSVAANLLHALAVAGVPRADRQRRLSDLLQLAGLQSLAGSPARKLSGGEQQRLALVRALAARPSVLFLDEPTASLDPQATAMLEDLIQRISDCGVKVVIVTHDQGQAARLADEVMFIHQGKVLEIQNTHGFLKQPLTRHAKAYLAGELLID